MGVGDGGEGMEYVGRVGKWGRKCFVVVEICDFFLYFQLFLVPTHMTYLRVFDCLCDICIYFSSHFRRNCFDKDRKSQVRFLVII